MSQITRQRMLFDYISKLNDRDIAKRQSSGFTLYATVGLFIILAARYIERIPIINGDSHTRELLLLTFTSIANMSFALLLSIVCTLPSFSLDKRSRLKSRLEEKYEPFSKMIIGALLLMYTTANVFTALTARNFKATRSRTGFMPD